ncbi:hypothetical protein D3C73_776000 [compost metagenome]
MVLRFVADHCGKTVLRRAETGEGVVLVHLAEFSAHRRRRHRIADLPAGAVVGLAEAGDDEGALAQLRVAQCRFMAAAVVDDVLVHLIGDQVDLRAAQHIGQRLHVRFVQHRAGRVVRGVDHQQAGARGDRRTHAVPVDGEGLRIQRHVHRRGTGQLDRRFVAVVGRVEHDHFLTGTHHGVDGVEDRLGGAAGDGDLGVRIDLRAVQVQRLLCDGLAQRCHAGHRRVLVQAGGHRLGGFVDQTLRRGEIREPLAEVDRAMFGGELGHHGEDRGTDLGQLGVRLHRPGLWGNKGWKCTKSRPCLRRRR